MSSDDDFDFDPLDPEATVSGVEGPSATNMDIYRLRLRMLAGDEEGVDIVERLRFHAERGWRSPVSRSSPLMDEAAALIEQLRS